MNLDQIETALGQHLEAMPDCPPVAWPNADAPGVVPYLEFRLSPNTRRMPGISGQALPIQDGILLVTVVSARGQFTGPANNLAQAVADRFLQALRLPAGAGNVVITDASEFGQGFTDGVHYRQPVRIRYTTEETAPIWSQEFSEEFA